MGTRSRKPKLSEDDARQSVLRFFDLKQKFESVQEQFNKDKAQFNSEMEEYFQGAGIRTLEVEHDSLVDGVITVTRVQKSNVAFDADKLEAALGKRLAGRVILKHYEIADMYGLIAYLKECGVDPKIFKSFLVVTKQVNTKELDRLEEIGELSVEQVKGCYTVKAQNPYFTVKNGKGKGGSD